MESIPLTRVAVAMSGGVDSSVTAALLKEQGHDVFGVTMRMRPEDEKKCLEQARAVCDQLLLPHHVVDCQAEFEDLVLRHCWSEYAAGRTPNPCVVCNRHIKFGLLLERARSLGAQSLATGHYARLRREADGHVTLLRGRDTNKDQSYFLFALDQAQLAQIQMPLGEMTKVEVRALAERFGLSSAHRAESQDACFVEEGEGMSELLRRRFDGTSVEGELVDTCGRVHGRHGGIHRFTVGQRRGIGVAFGQRAWVKEIDPSAGRVIVSTDERALYAGGLLAAGLNWGGQRPAVVRCAAQIRYRHRAVPARAILNGADQAWVIFDQPERAVTPGQAVVLYDQELLLGGGWIVRPLAEQEIRSIEHGQA